MLGSRHAREDGIAETIERKWGRVSGRSGCTARGQSGEGFLDKHFQGKPGGQCRGRDKTGRRPG